jgi:hypothetical protein
LAASATRLQPALQHEREKSHVAFVPRLDLSLGLVGELSGEDLLVLLKGNRLRSLHRKLRQKNVIDSVSHARRWRH